jgi:cytochrome c-type biogenesis protein CcmE
MIGRIAEMGAMRALMLAKASVSQNALRVGLPSHATMTVAYSCGLPVALRLNQCVMTAKTWLTTSAKASVTPGSQEMRTRIGGLVKMGPKSVSSRRLAVTGIQIVTMPLN